MPTKRASFHIGIGSYDPQVYEATGLISAATDAREMYNLATNLGYTAPDQVVRELWDGSFAAKPPNVRIDKEATYAETVGLFRECAALLKDKGDQCLITFSGHGTRFIKDPPVPAGAGTTIGAQCLYDFPLHDDVLCGLLAEFTKGVDIFLMLDCCQSGGTSGEPGNLLNNQVVAFDLIEQPQSAFGVPKAMKKLLVPPPPLPTELLAKFKGFDRSTIAANVAAFEACRDTESTFAGKNPDELSVYTKKFSDAVADGTKTVRAVVAAIDAMPEITNCHPQFQHTKDETFLDKSMKA